jgi:hypothetical protein
LRPGTKAREKDEDGRREAVRAGLEGDRNLSTRLPRFLSSEWGNFTRLEGFSNPLSHVLAAFGRRCGFRCFAWAGRIRGARRGRLQRGRTLGEDRPLGRGNSVQCERTRRRNKASKRVKLAERGGLLLRSQGDQEACSRVREKGAHSRRGNQATASEARESGKPTVIRTGVVRFSTSVDNRREQRPSRGGTVFCEGNTLKGEPQERLRHETRPRNSGLLGNRWEVEKT